MDLFYGCTYFFCTYVICTCGYICFIGWHFNVSFKPSIGDFLWCCVFLKFCSRCWYDIMWLFALDMFLCLVCDRVFRLWVTGGGMMISSVSDGSGESGKMKWFVSDDWCFRIFFFLLLWMGSFSFVFFRFFLFWCRSFLFEVSFDCFIIGFYFWCDANF